jgi:hypothetical protein
MDGTERDHLQNPTHQQRHARNEPCRNFTQPDRKRERGQITFTQTDHRPERRPVRGACSEVRTRHRLGLHPPLGVPASRKIAGTLSPQSPGHHGQSRFASIRTFTIELAQFRDRLVSSFGQFVVGPSRTGGHIRYGDRDQRNDPLRTVARFMVQVRV